MIQIDFFPWWLNCLIILLVVFVVAKNYTAIRRWWCKYKRENEELLAVVTVLFPIAVFILGVCWALGVGNSHTALGDMDGKLPETVVVTFISVSFYVCSLTAEPYNSEEVTKQKIYWFVGLTFVVIFLFILSISWPKAIIYLALQSMSLIPLYSFMKE